MKARSILSVFACAAIFAVTTSSWAGGREKGEYQRTHPQAQAQAPIHSSAGCSGYFDPTGHTNLQKTMPPDVCVVSTTSVVSRQCDENGYATKDKRPKWVCVTYATKHEKFHAVYEATGGRMGASKVFLVAVMTPTGWNARHELWSTGQNTAVTWMSDRASRQYASNGGDRDQVIIEGGSNSPPTQHAPVQQAKADCGRLDLVQRLACEAANNAGLGAAIGAGVKAFGK